MEKPTRLVDRPKPDIFIPPPYFRKFDKINLIRNELDISDPAKLLKLSASLQGVDFREIETKICSHLTKETNSDLVFIFHICYERDEASLFTCDGRHFSPHIRYHLDNEILQNLQSLTSNVCNLLNIQIEDVILQTTNMVQCQVLSVPVKRIDEAKVELIVCMVNSKLHPDSTVSHIKETFKYTLTVLLNTRMYSEELRLKEQCQQLLAFVRDIDANLAADYYDLLKEIIAKAKQMCNAERCSLFILNEENTMLVAKIFDGGVNADTVKDICIPRDQGICGHVVTTGKILNIKDPYEYPLFYKGMDTVLGYVTRNILCFPIRDGNEIFGAMELCNKTDENFNIYDEDKAAAFSIYCGQAIRNGIIYKKIKDEQTQLKISTEFLMNNMKIEQEEVDKWMTHKDEPADLDWKQLSYSLRPLPLEKSPCFVVKMFNSLNLTKKFRIKDDTLIRFALYVQSSYKDLPYHNWMHGLSVCHFVFSSILNFSLVRRKYITDLEALAFLTAALVHDVDHRIKKHSFELEIENHLASLYNCYDSTFQNHQFTICVHILNTEGCNILQNLDSKKYTTCLEIINKIMVASDLKHYFIILPDIKDMAVSGFIKENFQHKYLLLDLIMTCADLSDQIKDWNILKTTTQSIYTEYFIQGEEINYGSNIFKYKTGTDIPVDQIEFIIKISLPSYKILALLFKEARGLIKILKSNLECWKSTIPIFSKYWNAISASSLDKLAQLEAFENSETEGEEMLEEENQILEEEKEKEIIENIEDDIAAKPSIIITEKHFIENITYILKKC